MDLDFDGDDAFPEEDNYSKMPEVGLEPDSMCSLQHRGLCIGVDTNVWAPQRSTILRIHVNTTILLQYTRYTVCALPRRLIS